MPNFNLKQDKIFIILRILCKLPQLLILVDFQHNVRFVSSNWWLVPRIIVIVELWSCGVQTFCHSATLHTSHRACKSMIISSLCGFSSEECRVQKHLSFHHWITEPNTRTFTIHDSDFSSRINKTVGVSPNMTRSRYSVYQICQISFLIFLGILSRGNGITY